MIKLRGRIQNIKSDVHILHTSNKLKLQELNKKMVSNGDPEGSPEKDESKEMQ